MKDEKLWIGITKKSWNFFWCRSISWWGVMALNITILTPKNLEIQGRVAAYDWACRHLNEYLIDNITFQLQIDRGIFLISYFGRKRQSCNILQFYEKKRSKRQTIFQITCNANWFEWKFFRNNNIEITF